MSGECGQVLSIDKNGNPIWVWNWSEDLNEDKENVELSEN